MFQAKFQVNWPYGSGEEAKNRFSRRLLWRPSCIFDRNEFTYFDLQVNSILPTKFQVNWRFGSGEEAKNRFQRWLPWRPSLISDRNDFSFSLICNSPRCFLLSFKSVGLSVREKKRKLEFQDGRHDGHFGFPIRMILAIFHLQVIPIYPSKFQVNWPFASEEEAKNRFT